MRTPLIMGNWKLNGSTQFNVDLTQKLCQYSNHCTKEIAVCPPFVYLTQIRDLIDNKPIQLGAQNVDINDTGAFTGEISTKMLKDIGCTYVILGHSERRTLHQESDAVIAGKFKKVVATGLKPVLCIGENLAQFEIEQTEQVVETQLQSVIHENGIESFANAVIAYEPIWAIGTGKTATPEVAQKVHAFIRSYLATLNTDIAKNVRILYGGSVKSNNVAGLLSMEDIDGALVGGASLIADEFIAICNA